MEEIIKYEFVDFYPNKESKQKKKKNKFIGTVHIYHTELQLDIRGILVINTKNGVIFSFPHFRYFDDDGKPKKYPLLRFCREEDHEELWNFMKEKVKPIVEERVKSQSGK